MDSVLAGGECKLPGRSWEARQAQRGESRREQQFYRYYGPFQQMSDYGPKFCNVRDPQARESHKATPCPDKILTAFCQLGALRMKARRCLIFFFDVNHAYIMAEATKTLSLEDDTTHEPGDELWMGHSAIPRDIACCETTVNLPSFPTSAAEGDVSKSAFVVNDLTKHPDLCNRPYVTGYPHGRFYAGVPITTPAGVNIGAYCILDDEVRDGVSKEDLIFMGDMSQTVMTHLETVRALSERQQSNQMVQGLGEFVRDAPDLNRKAQPATNMPLSEGAMHGAKLRTVENRVPDSLVDPVATPGPLTPHSAKQEYFTNTGDDHQASATEAASQNDWQNHFLDRQMRADSWAGPKGPKSTGSVGSDRVTRPPIRTEDPNDRVKATYQRAAEVLCRSLDIDGVAFLDASVGTFGGLSRTQSSDSTTEGSADSEDSSNPHTFSDSEKDEPRQRKRKTCRVLGCAQSVRNEENEPQASKKLTESFLRKLMTRNPQGKVWTFDENLRMHSEEGFASDTDSGDGEAVSAKVSSPGTHQRKSDRRVRRSDGEDLQLAFPGARCIALHGIWDHTRKRWSTGGLYWTYDPLKYISKDSEMQFVAAFCDVVVSETKRLEVLGSDKAKSDFISSVSHELRSPLHGILGSCEVLAEHELDNTAMTLVEQIDSCGHSLLEIIDHLLDFANLKNQRLKKGAVKSSKIGRKFLPSTGGASASGNLEDLDMGVALDDLTEDAIVASVYSFYYNQATEDRSHTPVILDIDRLTDDSWRCQVASGGWRRICMNLVTNALKYTPSGFVRISLKQKTRTGPRRRFDAVLSVTDSGKGMSKEFQKNHLFHDFSQENTLSSGLGLGMHMVSRMVNAMGGKIEVSSDQKGTGTRVTVTIPMEHKRDSQDRTYKADEESRNPPRALEGLSFGLITYVHTPPSDREGALVATANAMAIASIEKNCTYLGARSEKCRWQDSDDHYDLKVVMEVDMHDVLKSLRDTEALPDRGSLTPMLVICTNSPSAQILRDIWASDPLSSRLIVEYIALPCSLKQIARAVSSALHSHRELVQSAADERLVDLPVRAPQPVPSEDAAGNPESATQPESHGGEPETQLHPEAHSSEQPFKSSQEFESKAGIAGAEHISHAPAERPASATTTHLPRGRASTLQGSFDISPPGARTPEPPSTESPAVPEIPPSTKGPILLLVDDNNINLQLLATFAKKRKYPHITAVDGQLAVNAYENAHRKSESPENATGPTGDVVGMPNVILLDINMPVMDGYEAAQRIRAYEKKHHMVPAKIIAVTALQSEAAHTEAFGSGFDMFLSKPLKLKHLAKLIEEE